MSFCFNRRQYKRTTGAKDKKTAEKIYAKVLTMIVEGKWFEFDEAGRHTFEEMMDKYFENSRIHKRPESCKNDRTYIKHLSVDFAGLTLDKIVPEAITCYRDRRLSAGISPQTVAHEMGCLNHGLILPSGNGDGSGTIHASMSGNQGLITRFSGGLRKKRKYGCSMRAVAT